MAQPSAPAPAPPQSMPPYHQREHVVQGVYAFPYGVPPPVAGAQFRSDFVAVVPPSPSRAQFDEIVKHRRVGFSSSVYFRQAWHFVKQNACNLISALFCYMLILGLLEVLNAHVVSVIFPIPPHPIHSSRGKLSPTSSPDDDSMYYFHEDGSINTQAMTVPTHMDLYVERTITRMIFSFAETILIVTPIHVSAITSVFDALRHNRMVLIGDLLGGKMTQIVYWRLLPLASILAIGSALLLWTFVIPGVLFAWYTMFCLPLFVDHGHYLSAWENIKSSAKLIHRYTCSMLLFWVQVIAVLFLGLMACGFGVFISLCVAFIAWIYCYHHIFPINGVAIWVPRWSPSVAHMAEAGGVGAGAGFVPPAASNPDAVGIAVAVPYPGPGAAPVQAAGQAVWAQEHQPLVRANDVPPHPATDAL